jgi:hypothetical protein
VIRCWGDEEIEELARTAATGGSLVEEHLKACAYCRHRLDRARADRALLCELNAARLAKASPLARAGEDERVPGYRIEGEIQRGGQGIVYRAVQQSTKRVVALKLLLEGAGATSRERRRFEREIELASRLDHPGIVTLFDSGETEGSPWCAMELVEGTRLDAWAQQRRRDPCEAAEIVRRIAAAVAHAHQRGVIHRDLKPANVVVDERGEPHVLDFGAALAGDGARERLRMTAPGEFLGTLAYAAPEQLLGALHAVDTRTDVYALGAVLYELLTGQLPFDAEHGLAQLVEGRAERVPPPPSAHRRGIDRDLDALTLKALATDPADRYGTAEALERDLARYLAGEPIAARKLSLGYVLRKHVVRRKKSVALGVGVLLLGAMFALAWLREHERADRQGEQAALVQSVIQDLLAAAAPERMGGDARLIDVYEILARDLEGALRGAPDVLAEVELTIGDTYRRLLRSREAEPHLRKAVERFTELEGPCGLEVARASNALALALADVNSPEAVEVAEAALAIRERELSSGDLRVAESRRTLAMALLQQFRAVDLERARGLLERAHADLLASRGDDHPDLAETRILLAQASYDLSPDAIESLLSGALAVLERSAPLDARALWASAAYAAFLQKHGRFDEARERLDSAGRLAHELYGDALAGDMLRRHAQLESERGNHPNAERLSRQAVARELERWAARSPQRAERLLALARRVEQPGSPPAEPPYAEAFAELRALEGDGSFELSGWMNSVSETLLELERGRAVEPILREALRIRCRAMGAECPIRRRTIELLASELAAERRGAEAVALLEESVAAFERAGQGQTPDAERARTLLADCRAQRDRNFVEAR